MVREIKTEQELNDIFEQMKNSLDNEKNYNYVIEKSKEELIKKLQIDENFFYENCILYVTDRGTGNGGFDYIEYNRISKKINLLEKREIFDGGNISMTESKYIYFVKLDKKYIDCEVDWKIKKVLFDL